MSEECAAADALGGTVPPGRFSAQLDAVLVQTPTGENPLALAALYAIVRHRWAMVQRD